MRGAHRVAWALLIPMGILSSGFLAMTGAVDEQGAAIFSRPDGTTSSSFRAPIDLPSVAGAGATADWWERVAQEIELLEYSPSRTDAGLQAPNRAHNLRIHFRPDGVELTPRTDPTDAWRWCWTTKAWGRAGRMQALAPVDPMCLGRRVEYEHPDFVEWYDNGKHGLEQGFTIAARPSGPGRLCIEGRIESAAGEVGPLRGCARPDGQAIDFCASPGGAVLSYEGLVARDARDTALPAHMVFGEDRLFVLIDDQEAVYPITVDPTLRVSSWDLQCGASGALFGVSVATPGDVDGDGYSDLLVGAPYYDGGQSDEGRVFLYLGSPDGPSAAPAWFAEGERTNAYLGACVATAGDVNGDGYDDILVGAYGYSAGFAGEGAAFAWYGSASGLGPMGVPNNADWRAVSGQAGAALGLALATAGDINSDGCDDVIVGGYGYDNGQTDEGRVWVYHGTASGLSPGAAWTAESNQSGACFGYAVATAGDVNADGYDDVIVGAYLYDGSTSDVGAACVWLGSSIGLGPSGTPSNADWVGQGSQRDSHYGWTVSLAGDVNGDGYGDVIVGAPQYDNGEANEGRAFLYLGRSTGLASTPAWQWEPDEPAAQFGSSVATAGDYNGDGYADVIAGAPALDPLYGPSDAGCALIFAGSQIGLSPDPWKRIAGEQTGSGFGRVVATAGDMNGDGLSDVIIGAPTYGGSDGKATVYRGWWQTPLTNGPPSWTAEGNQAECYFGVTLAAAGDINGDGYGDVIVGAPLYDSGQTDEGSVFVYLGSDDGIEGAYHWRGQGDQEGAQFGAAVAAAGDVNGDGFDDVIIGVPYYDSGQTDEGIALVYHGSANGMPLGGGPSIANWWTQANQVDAHLGYLAAKAGDVNGDGFGDVIVGAPHHDGAVANQGLVLVWHGGPTGLTPGSNPANADWTATSNTASAQFGYSGGTAGDVNGDGFSDVLIGAYNMSNGQATEGMALAWYGSSSGLGPAGSPGNADWVGEGNWPSARFGYSLGTAGDTNGDGYSDIIVGAYSYADATSTGGAYVYFGGPAGLSPTPNWEHHLATTANWNYGYAVSTAGDFNADGYSDILVGANLLTNGEAAEGGAYAYCGSPTGPEWGPAWFAEGNQANAFYGAAVAGVGDVNGDGFGDILIGAYRYDHGQTNEGMAYLYYGNWCLGTLGDGILKLPRQARADDTAPIALLGSSGSDSAFRAKLWGRTPAGRGKIRLEWEVKRAGVAFDGTGLGQSLNEVDTGLPVAGAGSRVAVNELIASLSPGTAFHWRVRTLSDSPFFPHSLWLSPAGNGAGETDFRTTGTPSSVATTEGEWSAIRLNAPFPNPAGPHLVLSYTLPRAAVVQISVYDIVGRSVAILAAGPQPAGTQTATWDGLSAEGVPVPSGAYFARLASGGESVTRRFILMR